MYEDRCRLLLPVGRPVHFNLTLLLLLLVQDIVNISRLQLAFSVLVACLFDCLILPIDSLILLRIQIAGWNRVVVLDSKQLRPQQMLHTLRHRQTRVLELLLTWRQVSD